MRFAIFGMACVIIVLTTGYCLLSTLIDWAFEKYEKIRGENSDLDELIRLAEKYPTAYMFVYMKKRLAEYPDPQMPTWKEPEESPSLFQSNSPSDSTFVP